MHPAARVIADGPMIHRALLLAAALALTAEPAAAQTAQPTLIDTSLQAILLVCTSAIRDKFDLNDTAALARYGLKPLDAESEARMRRSKPGIEAASMRFRDGYVLVGRAPNGPCNTLITGDGYAAVRDQLISQLESHDFRSKRHDGADYQDQVFDVGAATIGIRTRPGVNNVTVSVTLAAAGTTVASPAPAQAPDKIDMIDAGVASVLAICVPVMAGSFDINDAAALAPFGFRPWSGADEAEVRASVPGIEIASADTDDGSVVIGAERDVCTSKFVGDRSVAVRDALIRQLTETGVRQQRIAEDGSVTLAFFFTAASIYVDTRNGKIMVQVRRPQNQ